MTINMRMQSCLGIMVVLRAISAAQTQLPPAKQAIEQQYTTERLNGAQNPAPRNLQFQPLVPPASTEAAGIFDDADAPFSPQGILISNRWESGNALTVYAGALASNPQQGIAMVTAGSAYPAEPTFQEVLTPIQTGAVHIVAAQDGLLLLTSAGSKVFTLNVASSTFTSVETIPLMPVAASNIIVSTSGFVYSRVSQTSNGTVTAKNVGISAIAVPIQLVLQSLPNGVTVVNANDTYNGSPVVTAPATKNLAPGQSVTLNVQFRNPSNVPIKPTFVTYSGSLQ